MGYRNNKELEWTKYQYRSKGIDYVELEFGRNVVDTGEHCTVVLGAFYDGKLHEKHYQQKFYGPDMLEIHHVVAPFRDLDSYFNEMDSIYRNKHIPYTIQKVIVGGGE